MPSIFGNTNRLSITYTFDDAAKGDTLPSGIRYYNYIDLDNTNNYLVEIQGNMNQFKACV